MILNPPIVDTRIRKNFLTEEDLALIRKESTEYNQSYIGEHYEEGELACKITLILDNPAMRESEKLLCKKLHEEFGPNLIIGGLHILDSRIPYRAHTDGIYGEYGIDDKHYGAWTIVIPLETVDSHTIIFNEWYVKSKDIAEWIETVEPLDSIDDATYEKYLSYEARDRMRYLSVDTIFPWQHGTMLAASRYKWHASDNYKKNNVGSKRAIIAWTALSY